MAQLVSRDAGTGEQLYHRLPGTSGMAEACSVEPVANEQRTNTDENCAEVWIHWCHPQQSACHMLQRKRGVVQFWRPERLAHRSVPNVCWPQPAAFPLFKVRVA